MSTKREYRQERTFCKLQNKYINLKWEEVIMPGDATHAEQREIANAACLSMVGCPKKECKCQNGTVDPFI